MSVAAKVAGTLRSHFLLCILVLAGIGLRVAATIADRPVVMVYGDSYSYLRNAIDLSPGTFHPLVYSLLLLALWWTGHLQSVVILQHMLAILLAPAIYATLCRLAVRRWLAALSVAPLLLDAYQVFLEQNILADTLFEVFVTASLIVVIWWRRSPRRWTLGVVAGLLAAAAVLTRGPGLAVIPALLFAPTLSGRGWRPLVAALLTAVVLLGAYAAWNDQVNGQFTIDQSSGRWLYGRVAVMPGCQGLRGIPRDERVLCDPALGGDPKAHAAVDDGIGFYVWDRRSPFYRLKAGPHQTPDQMAQDYALRVIAQQPLQYAWSVVVDTGLYFAPTRAEVGQGQSPLDSQNFQPVTNPGQNHVLLGTQSFQGQTQAGRLPGPQRARWPVVWLNRYQLVGYTPGPVLAACLVLVLIAWLWGSRDQIGREQREGAVLFGITGLLLILIPAAVAGNEYRYLLPALPVIPPAGAMAIESLARRGRDRFLERESVTR